MSKQEIVRLEGLKVDATKFRNFEQALRRFNRKIKDSGMLMELRERETYTPKGEKNRKNREKAKRRTKRQIANEQADRTRFY